MKITCSNYTMIVPIRENSIHGFRYFPRRFAETFVLNSFNKDTQHVLLTVVLGSLNSMNKIVSPNIPKYCAYSFFVDWKTCDFMRRDSRILVSSSLNSKLSESVLSHLHTSPLSKHIRSNTHTRIAQQTRYLYCINVIYTQIIM